MKTTYQKPVSFIVLMEDIATAIPISNTEGDGIFHAKESDIIEEEENSGKNYLGDKNHDFQYNIWEDE